MQADIIRPDFGHARHVISRMQVADYEEMRALGVDPVETMLDSFRLALRSWCLLINGAPMAIWGVNARSLLSDSATPWLTATDDIHRHQVMALRMGRRIVTEMLRDHSHLWNVVWDGHTVAKRWLCWLGFQMSEPEPFGPKGLPFRRFDMWRKDVR